MDGAYFLFCGAPQNRKGIDAIAQLCREKLNADPFSGYLFIFRTRRGTAIRILQYDLCSVSSNVQSTSASSCCASAAKI
jgi:hypothetical protein